MNISQPVSSTVDSVEFTFLTTDEIRAISVKRIQNDNTFDELGNPLAGGLYDPALGSWGQALCTTCHLSQSSCPGHPGHIDLPVPVYHPIFMDQVLKLLRIQCVSCKGFRISRQELTKFACKLQLLQYGLLQEADMIDAIGLDWDGMNLPEDALVEASEAEEEGDPITEGSRVRNAFVARTLQRYKDQLSGTRQAKPAGASEMRIKVIKEFFTTAASPKNRKCATCGVISPTYRKDRFAKIFEKPLSDRDRVQMAQRSFRMRDVLAIPRQKAAKGGSYHSDEGVADIDLSSSSEEDAGRTEQRSDTDGDDRGSSTRQRLIHAMEVLARLDMLFAKEQAFLSLLYNSRVSSRVAKPLSADMFFIKAVLVPPNRFRPETRRGNERPDEAQQNSLFRAILQSCAKIARLHKQMTDEPSRDINLIHEAWIELQDTVNSLIDMSKNPSQGLALRSGADGIKQKLEKKEGLFRMNMMGKRVNFAARSVISPDPNIETNEIGVPPVFAQKLTYPEPVTSHNFREMKRAVMYGAEKWPGASAIEYENGQIVNLRAKSAEERTALANQLLAPTNSNFSGIRNKKVHRHLTDGDVVLMNRQPTLHKPSIMGHRVRVLPGEKTIRMHYANCNTYNADFDGDEMNMHFPQTEVARAEALQIADTDHQYLSGTQGKPLRGLIQDHLSVSVALCNRDTFFNRGEFQQLVYGALRPENRHILGERIEVVPPAIIKPMPRWTGKQVITTILKNITPLDSDGLWLRSESSIKADRWGSSSEEGTVVFHAGEFISGILDKSQLGPSSGGFIHAIHEVYGPASASKLLSSLGRLLTRYLNMRAFTCGMDDLRLTPAGETVRKETLEAAQQVGLDVAAKYVSLDGRNVPDNDPELLARLEEVMRDDTKQEGLDLLMNQQSAKVTTQVAKNCLPRGLAKDFPKNHMQSMTISGAKGGPINANLISCNLGQQVLEGRRVPLMISGKSLPCFDPFETNVRAGGYIVNRFLTGIRPQEYYFHHMAGREGLIDTAVKTANSGYLQRCIIKGMEGLTVAYDLTVRDSDGALVQFLYGEDGIGVEKERYLTDFSFVLHNAKSEIARLNIGEAASRVFSNKDDITKHHRSAIKHARANNPRGKDPINSLLPPGQFAYATSENFFDSMTNYLKDNKDGIIVDKERSGERQLRGLKRKGAEAILVMKHFRSLVEPGEAVGIVAGQSVGEPSTQMTLNTFHLAGASARNVTLGIPRLREILMMASASIKTPSMALALNEELSEADGQRFAKAISVLPLSHVIDHVTVRERVGKGQGYVLAKTFDIRLQFFPSEKYTAEYAIQIPDVMDAIEKRFLDHLVRGVKTEIRKKTGSNNPAAPTVGAKAGVIEMARTRQGEETSRDVDDDDDDVGDDNDATNTKMRSRRTEATSYGPNDDEDDAIQQQMEREASPDDEDEGFFGSPPPSDGNGIENGSGEGGARAERVLQKFGMVTRFHCDEQSGEWCEVSLEYDSTIPKLLMLNMVQAAVKKSVIQQIPGVGACIYSPLQKQDSPTGRDTAKGPQVMAMGVNLRAMQGYGDMINPNKIATNDIAAVLDVYGVEACRSNIILELRNVFDSHGIKVDTRHLNLIADHMTRTGSFRPLNRNGLRTNPSPFTKMSFETTLAFLRDAVLDGDWDSLTTPSSRIVMGKLGKVGTGSFDVITKLPTSHLASMR